jgi:ligand-binding sensor protein
MELTDLVPVESWRQVAEDVYKKFGFNSCIYNRDNMIVHPPVGWANELCPLIKAGDSRVICAASQKNFATKVSQSRDPFIDECEAGFTKFLVPIFVDGEFLGSAGGCGCLIAGNTIDVFYLSKLLVKDEQEIKNLLDTVPRIERDKITEALRYLQKRLEQIIKDARIL